ncbi:MAG: helix-turn-helix domain-containing protein [Ardenticatenales bacterium]|nr:helix-turn-helix domain-containing protein [Ardenticatenales bacterium]
MADRVLLTVKDVQELTQLGRTTVYALIRTGELPTVRFGRLIRVRREALDTWLAKMEESERLLSLPF